MTIKMVTMLGAAAVLFATPGLDGSAGAAFAQQAKADKKNDAKDDNGDTTLKSVGNVASKPLRDMNIVKKDIPAELEAMMEEPYSMTGIKTCKGILSEVKRINGLLGPDVDSPQVKAGDGGQTSSEVVFGASEALVGSLIPFSGVIRVISGAAKRERYAQAAVFAGSVRRAYLKGMGRTRGCKGLK